MERYCSIEHDRLELEVLQSAAGYYVGQFCPECGPYDRLSGYYPGSGQAAAVLICMEDEDTLPLP